MVPAKSGNLAPGAAAIWRCWPRTARYWKMEADLSKKVWDLQRAFSITVGTGQSVALYRAVEYCGVPAPFEFHNALNDCVYTAVVSQWDLPGGYRRAVVARLGKKIYLDL